MYIHNYITHMHIYIYIYNMYGPRSKFGCNQTSTLNSETLHRHKSFK